MNQGVLEGPDFEPLQLADVQVPEYCTAPLDRVHTASFPSKTGRSSVSRRPLAAVVAPRAGAQSSPTQTTRHSSSPGCWSKFGLLAYRPLLAFRFPGVNGIDHGQDVVDRR